MKLIAILNEKGGAGKTASALAYIGQELKNKANAVILDLDTNGQAAHTISKMGDGKLNGRVIRPDAIDHVSVLKTIQTLVEDHGVETIIIDTPPEIGEAFYTSVKLSKDFEESYLIVPCQPGATDISLTSKTIDVLKNQTSKTIFVQPVNTRQNEQMTRVLKLTFISMDQVELLPSLDRSAPFSKATLAGLTVQEFKPDAPIAAMIEKAHTAMVADKYKELG